MCATYDFGVFHLDATEHQLLRDGRPVPLPPKAFDLLVDLVEHAGHLREKKQLMDLLWPGTFVEEANLSYTARAVRKALGDDKDRPRYVETVPTKGYRFIGAVTRHDTSSAFVTGPDASCAMQGPGAASQPSASPAVFPVVRTGRQRGRSAFVGGIALALALVMTASLAPWRSGKRLAPITSIAVLPLDDLSGSRDYFADGITDEIIVEISRRASLQKVINRRAALLYKRSPKTSAEIARELGVDALLIGSVSKSAGGVRASVQLVRASDERVLWAGRYEREPSEILALEHDLVRDLLAAIYVQTLPEVGTQGRTVEPVAYDLYLQGLAAFARYDAAGLAAAPALFRQAIAKDPGLARAHASLALALTHATLRAFAPIARDETERAAATALALDEGLGDAHAALAVVHDLYEWNWTRGAASLDRALTLSPNSALVHIVAAHHDGWLGEFDASVAHARRAVQLEPGSTAALGALFWALHFAGRSEEMLAVAPEALRVSGGLKEGEYFVSLHEALLGRVGVVCSRRARTPVCGLALARAGRLDEARHVLRQACPTMRHRGRWIDNDSFCVQLAAALGDREPLAAGLEALVDGHDFLVPFLRAPEWGGLVADEPRYQAALRKAGLAR